MIFSSDMYMEVRIHVAVHVAASSRIAGTKGNTRVLHCTGMCTSTEAANLKQPI